MEKKELMKLCLWDSQMGKLGFMREVDLIQILLLGFLVLEIQFQSVILLDDLFSSRENIYGVVMLLINYD